MELDRTEWRQLFLYPVQHGTPGLRIGHAASCAGTVTDKFTFIQNQLIDHQLTGPHALWKIDQQLHASDFNVRFRAINDQIQRFEVRARPRCSRADFRQRHLSLKSLRQQLLDFRAPLIGHRQKGEDSRL